MRKRAHVNEVVIHRTTRQRLKVVGISPINGYILEFPNGKQVRGFSAREFL